MPTKRIIKSDVKSSKESEKRTKTSSKKDTTKKVVVKRRKTDLKPTKASAVAIASQANREKKQALIEKVANSGINQNKREVSNTKIPLWVRVLFWCSLMFFCISIYQAYIRPQLENEIVAVNDVYSDNYSEDNKSGWEAQFSVDSLENSDTGDEILMEDDKIVQNPQNPEELIQTYFAYMSKGDFDGSFSLFDDRTQKDKNIREHFTAFRMAPFFEWIEWKSIIPKNIRKIVETYKWNEVYSFDISYTLESTHEQYDETWKFSTSNKDWELKILMLYCVSSKCANHPIFWPEDFGLMR